MGPTPDDSGVVPIGAMLDGRYRVDSVLGKGGMGRVYKGEHTGIGRAVAIKVLHADLGRNKEAAARFQREALHRMGRGDLIGGGKHCLVPSWQPAQRGGPRSGQRSGKPLQPGVALTQHTGLPPMPGRPRKR